MNPLESVLDRLLDLPPDLEWRDARVKPLEEDLLAAARARFGPDSEVIGRYQLLRSQFDYGRSSDQIQGMFEIFLRDVRALLSRAIEREVQYISDDGWREGFDVEALADGSFRVLSVPVSARGFATGDTIAVKTDPDGTRRFDRVLTRSGNKLVRFVQVGGWNSEGFARKIEALGCTWEHSFGCVVLIHIPRDVSFRPIKALLAELGIEGYEYAHRR